MKGEGARLDLCDDGLLSLSLVWSCNVWNIGFFGGVELGVTESYNCWRLGGGGVDLGVDESSNDVFLGGVDVGVWEPEDGISKAALLYDCCFFCVLDAFDFVSPAVPLIYVCAADPCKLSIVLLEFLAFFFLAFAILWSVSCVDAPVNNLESGGVNLDGPIKLSCLKVLKNGLGKWTSY